MNDAVGAANDSEVFWPLQVILHRKRIERGRWEADSWSVAAVESERGAAHAELRVEARRVDDHCDAYCWSGLGLELFRDERAAYRFNLSAQAPRLFVICSEDEEHDGLMRPLLVSASQDAAAAYMDGGEEDVFSVAMPVAIQCWIEAFIVRHGEPDLGLRKGKRRRYRDGRKLEAGDE